MAVDRAGSGASFGVTATVSGADGRTLLTVTRHTEPTGAGHRGDLVVVTVAGDVDLQTVALLRTALSTAIAAGSPVCCDLRAVTFFGATGANALIVTHNEAVATGCRFWVRAGIGRVREVIRIAGLDRTLAVHP